MHSKFPGDLLIKHKPAVSGRNSSAKCVAVERLPYSESVAEQIWQIE